MTNRVPDLLLERLALNELPPDFSRDLRQRLASEVGGEARLAALKQDDRLILREHPAGLALPRIRARAGSERHQLLLPRLTLMATALLAALWLVRPSPPTERIKGLEPTLVLHRASDAGPERLSTGAEARPGDLLQVGYVAADARFGVVVSIDGAGHVELHQPATARASTELEGGGRVDLPFAYELDGAPAFERFVLITSPDRLDAREVLAAARAVARTPEAESGALELPPPAREQSILIRKAP